MKGSALPLGPLMLDVAGTTLTDTDRQRLARTAGGRRHPVRPQLRLAGAAVPGSPRTYTVCAIRRSL